LLHDNLALDREALTAEIRAALFAVGAEIMVEKVVLATTAPGAVATPTALPDGLLAALRQTRVF
jgi:hypothetical protein